MDHDKAEPEKETPSEDEIRAELAKARQARADAAKAEIEVVMNKYRCTIEGKPVPVPLGNGVWGTAWVPELVARD